MNEVKGERSSTVSQTKISIQFRRFLKHASVVELPKGNRFDRFMMGDGVAVGLGEVAADLVKGGLLLLGEG